MNENVQTIYGIPVSELSKEPVRVKNGTYYNFKGYNVYVPDEVESSTSAFIYYPGSGGSGNDAKIINNIIESGSATQIIIIADDAYTDRKTGGARHLQLIENIASENGVEITNIDTMGFSAGGPSTYNTLLNTISSYPESGPHNAVFCDVVGFTVDQDQINMLVEDEATLLFLEPNNQVTDFEKKLAQGGVDVILAWTSGSHAGHVPLNREALQNGIIDFVSGESDELANSEIYKFVTYDMNSGQWYEIPLEEVAEKFVNSDVADNPFRYYNRLSNMDTELQCNNSFLGNKINTIRTAIKNSNFLSSMSMEYYGSTTQVPNAANEVVQAFYSSCAKMLNYLEKDTSKIIEIGNSIKEINDNLKTEAEDLNTSINYYTNNANTSNNTTGTNSWTNVSANNTGTSGNSNNYSGSYSNNSSGNYGGTYYGSSAAVGGAVSSGVSTEVSTEATQTISDEFLEYNYLYSDTEQNMLVYKNTEENYKVVIHYENDKILSIDHYYQYPTRQIANDSIDILKQEYGTTCDDVLRETNTVKVVLDESTYKDLTLTELKAEYKEKEEMVELIKEK